MDRDRYHIIVEPLKQSTPVEIRLRRWLKLGLRYLGLKCIRIEPVDDAPPCELMTDHAVHPPDSGSLVNGHDRMAGKL